MDTSPREYSKTLDARNQAAKAALRVHRVSRMLIKNTRVLLLYRSRVPADSAYEEIGYATYMHSFRSPTKKRLWRRALVVLMFTGLEFPVRAPEQQTLQETPLRQETDTRGIRPKRPTKVAPRSKGRRLKL